MIRKIQDSVRYFKQKKYLEKDIHDYIGLPEKIFNDLEAVFVLSTGRAGTDLLTRLFRLNRNNFVLHEPIPDLVYAAKGAYNLGQQGLVARKLGITSSRYHLFKECYLRGLVYIETNNKLTFFADALYDLLPKSRFIHLIRDPRAFVRSAVRRGYYQGHDFDDGRITPQNINEEEWKNFSPIQKNGWLWNETNMVIEGFIQKFDTNRILKIYSEDLFKDPTTLQHISGFIDQPPSKLNQIEKILRKPVNQQLKNDFPLFNKWEISAQETLRSITPLAIKYGYWDI
ncbi:MAG: sulfotransferase [Candidatus Marinimicrobia bacterium]|nr:sulfotransferase [Candidatus Neomarinimicrobiota bacterium]